MTRWQSLQRRLCTIRYTSLHFDTSVFGLCLRREKPLSSRFFESLRNKNAKKIDKEQIAKLRLQVYNDFVTTHPVVSITLIMREIEIRLLTVLTVPEHVREREYQKACKSQLLTQLEDRLYNETKEELPELRKQERLFQKDPQRHPPPKP